MTIRITYNAQKMRYDLYAQVRNEFNFIFDMPPCKNVLKFFRGIKRDHNFYEYELNSRLIRIIKNGKTLGEE